MLNVSAERSENALAFQRELVAVVDKWVSLVETSEGDAFIKELLGYYRVRRMLVESVDRVEFARRCRAGATGGRGGSKVAKGPTAEMTDLSSKQGQNHRRSLRPPLRPQCKSCVRVCYRRACCR